MQELAWARSAATSERERRATTVEILDRLPRSGRVDEVDDRGRQRTYEVTPARARPPRTTASPLDPLAPHRPELGPG